MSYRIIKEKLSPIYDLCIDLKRFIQDEYPEDLDLQNMADSLVKHVIECTHKIGYTDPPKEK